MCYKITQDLNETDPPKPHEMAAAKILAEYFKSDLVFIRKGINSAPDILVKRTNQVWEIKSPLGNGKRTIANNLRDASRQAEKIALDLSRCKMNNEKALSKVRGFLASGDAHLKRLLIINKGGKVIDILRKER